MSGLVTALQLASFGRQLKPPQPADSMPSNALEFLQVLISVMSPGGSSFAKQLLPPQPAHEMPSSACEAVHTLCCLMSVHRWPVVPKARQPAVACQEGPKSSRRWPHL